LEIKILDIISKNRKASRKSISELINIREDTVKEYLKKLRGKGVLKRVGETSAGYWEVVGNE